VRWLFVYGTLMPGRLRWGLVADDVVDRRRAALAGTLYDTGRGYPAVVLAGPDGAGGDGGADVRVEGWLLGLPDPAAAAVLDRLDDVEGPQYRRATVTTLDGTEAVTYEWIGAADGFTALAGLWSSEDER
jgi:gamma-glutamylcyclotransferase (GGCT)/AIG2-like uncharacterized protein YtfP